MTPRWGRNHRGPRSQDTAKDQLSKTLTVPLKKHTFLSKNWPPSLRPLCSPLPVQSIVSGKHCVEIRRTKDFEVLFIWLSDADYPKNRSEPGCQKVASSVGGHTGNNLHDGQSDHVSKLRQRCGNPHCTHLKSYLDCFQADPLQVVSIESSVGEELLDKGD